MRAGVGAVFPDAKCPNQGLGVRGRGLQRGMHTELGETYLSRFLPGDLIGRINIYDTNPGFDAEGLYTLAVYVQPDG